jgi:hypothetical protein
MNEKSYLNTPNLTPRDYDGPASYSGINFTQFQSITQNIFSTNDKPRTSSLDSNSETSNTSKRLVCNFLKQHSSYDVLPVSHRVIVLDTSLLVKKALAALMQNGISIFFFFFFFF